jgi:SAM-dependent methyltransferase
MASSFPSQIPILIHLLRTLNPTTVLDIGKGFGKYGFLIHEYVGVDSTNRPDPKLTLLQQSRVTIDAVECNEDYLWPHLPQFYSQVHIGRIEHIYQNMAPYDVILMADVIEHLTKTEGLKVVKHFVATGSKVIISTPRRYFDQQLFQSEAEHHLSHWTAKDFGWCSYDHQRCDAGVVFLLSAARIAIRGFGNRPLPRARRLARAIFDTL